MVEINDPKYIDPRTILRRIDMTNLKGLRLDQAITEECNGLSLNYRLASTFVVGGQLVLIFQDFS